MGRSAAMQVGFNLIVLSLTSVALDLHLAGAAVAACIAVAVLIAVREVAEVVLWVRQVHPNLQY